VGVIIDTLVDVTHIRAFEVAMPYLRLAYTYTPVAGKTAAELKAYINGNDPVSNRPLMPEIIDFLTKPLTAQEAGTGVIERPQQRTFGPETEDVLTPFFVENWWTDQLPFILPTQERVAAMLKNTSHKPDEVIGQMAVTVERESWSYTVETVATNAVMAGLKPEFFPALLALAATQTSSRPSSSASKTAMAVFNGPIVQEIGLNYSTGALGLYNSAGALLGRAWALLSGNVTGGAKPNETYLGAQGNPIGNIPPVFAEYEAYLPTGWQPLHVQKGFKAGDSVVSTFTGYEGQNTMMVLQDSDWQWVLKKFMTFGIPHRDYKTLLFDPSTIGPLQRWGFDTKEKLITWIQQNCTWPKLHFWLDQEVMNYWLGPAQAGQEPYATWLKAPDDFEIPYLRNVNIVVVGGSTNVRFSCAEAGYSKSVKVSDWK
jgi:hypothetical protein